MEHDQDILSDAIERLKNDPIEPGPPQAAVEATLKALERAGADRKSQRTITFRFTTKLAAAAAVLILAGYAIGRVSAPRPPDMEQLKKELTSSLAATIEPAIREKLIQDMRQQWQVALTGGYMRLKDDLTEQYRADLNRYAVQTLAASNAVTNQLLGQLVQGLNTAQTEKMQQVAGALRQIEQNRLKDRSQLAASLEALAYQTEDDLQQTREDFVQLLSYITPPAGESSDSDRIEGIEKVD